MSRQGHVDRRGCTTFLKCWLVSSATLSRPVCAHPPSPPPPLFLSLHMHKAYYIFTPAQFDSARPPGIKHESFRRAFLVKYVRFTRQSRDSNT